MSIQIIDEPGPPLRLTQDQYRRLWHEYERAFRFYAGPVPSFEAWVRQRGQTFVTGDLTFPVTKEGKP